MGNDVLGIRVCNSNTIFESIDGEIDDMVENLESLDGQPSETGFDSFEKECKT